MENSLGEVKTTNVEDNSVFMMFLGPIDINEAKIEKNAKLESYTNKSNEEKSVK